MPNLSQDEFLQRVQDTWGDRWDYSKAVYRGTKAKVTIICREHGPFLQTAEGHWSGLVGCPGCSSRVVTPEDFLRRAQATWGDRWDYSKTKYIKSTEKVTITCMEHGDFQQRPVHHIKGRISCPGCRGLLPKDRQSQADRVWDGRWDYSYTFNGGPLKTVEIVCPEHGPFTQNWADHLKGLVGCTKCSRSKTSKAEKDVYSFVQSLFPSTLHRATGILHNLRQEVDIYVPEKKVALEYNGLFWHSFKDKNYHAEKTALCNEAGIRLLHVWEDDWLDRQEIVKRTIKNILGVSDLPKVAARKTTIYPIATHEAADFLDQYHIQGRVSSSVYLGLFYEGSLVGVATFTKRGEDYELSRYATSVRLQGGHSKVISYVEKNYSYRKLITFADLSYSEGNLYSATGWIEDGHLAPDYKYVVQGKRVHKFAYRKARFKNDPDLLYQEGLTERELAELNGLPRIYDAGKIRYIKPHP